MDRFATSSIVEQQVPARKIDLQRVLQPPPAEAAAPPVQKSAGDSAPSRRSWLWMIMLSLGLALIGVGVGRWWETRGPQQVLSQFFDAVRAGDRDRAVSLLIPMQQRLAEHPRDTEQLEPWKPSPKLSCRIEQLKVKGGRATAVVLMTDGDSRVHPTVELSRNRQGEWRIAGIDGFESESVWARAERERRTADIQQQEEQNRQISHDLIEALEGVPGVAVHRDSVRETTRR